MRLVQPGQARRDLVFDDYFSGDQNVENLLSDDALFVNDFVLRLLDATNLLCRQFMHHRAIVESLRVDARRAIVDIIVGAEDGAGEVFVQEFCHFESPIRRVERMRKVRVRAAESVRFAQSALLTGELDDETHITSAT